MLWIKTLLRQLIIPPAGFLLLAALGILLQRFRPRLGRAIALSCLAILWLLSTPIISDGLTSLTEHYGPLDLTRPTDAQAIVILGGGGQIADAPEYGGPAAQTIMLEKMAYGAYVARKTGLPILVTGTDIEAIAMRETLARNFGIATRWTEDKARDTFENAANSAPLLLPAGIHRIILVTRSTHLWRSAKEFEAVGFQVIPAPVGILSMRAHTSVQSYVPQASALLDSSLAVYELLGEPVRQFMADVGLRRQSRASRVPTS